MSDDVAGHNSTRAQPLGRSCRLRPAKIQRSFGKRTPCKAGTAVADPRSRSLQDMHISIPGITSAGQVRLFLHTSFGPNASSMTVMAGKTCNSKEGMISHTMCMHHRCWQLDWQSTCRPAASFPMTGSRWPAAASRRQSCPRHRQSGRRPQTPRDPLRPQSSLLRGTLVNNHLCCLPPAPCALWRTAEASSP